MTRRSLIVVVGLVISLLALWIVGQTIDVGEAAEVLGRAALLPLVAIVGVLALSVTLRARRWGVLLPTQDRIATVRLMPPMLIGYLGNAVLPARLGEPMRAVVVARREAVGTTEALGSVAVERLIDVATLSILAFIAALVAGGPSWAVQALGLVAAASLLGLLLLVTVGVEPFVRVGDRLGLRRYERTRQLITRFARTVGGRLRRTALMGAAAISIAAWLVDATSFWLAGQAVGADIGYVEAMLVAGVTVLGTAIPSAPGYVGTFELAATTVAGALGVPGAEALAMAIVAHVMTLAPVALGGAASLLVIGTNLGEIRRAAETSRRA